MCVIEFVSEISQIKYVINRFISYVNMQATLEEDKEFELRLVANELLANSITYAGKFGDVTVMYEAYPDHVSFCVADKGPGFCAEDKKNVDVCCEEYLFHENGRGLFLINQFAQSFRYNRKGNIALVKLEIPLKRQEDSVASL